MAKTICFMMLLVISLAQTAVSLPNPVAGLSWSFYSKTCPSVESVVWNRLQTWLNADITQAAGLLRLHFHDCFVQGCDASLLFNSTSGELFAPPNLSLRASALAIINDLKQTVEKACPGKVSCADLLTLAARDSVRKAGGPFYPVPLGRRDSPTFANRTVVNANLPSPQSNVSVIMAVLGPKGLTRTDLVALSGAHTIGRANCSSFNNRLFNNNVAQRDPTLDQTFAKHLYRTCPRPSTVNTTVNDIRSPNLFDNKYYVDLLNRQTLFTSDQSLYTDATTKSDVIEFAVNQTKFFEQFVLSMLKMGQLEVLTGSQGEIRKHCWASNSNSIAESDTFSIIEQVVTSFASF